MRRTTIVAAILLAACGTATTGDGTAPVTVVVDGVGWVLPAAACRPDDPETRTAAEAAAGEVESLVAARAAGWPTTTRAVPGSDAEFYVAVNRAGPTALALGSVADSTDQIVRAWAEFEAGYAGLEDSPGPLTVIADRLEGWQRTATAIVAALDSACG